MIGECMAKHRHQEFLRFLRRLDREFSKETPLHLIVDNYGTHNQSKVKAWLEKHPRFTLHFTPTSSSWLNLVERWFRELTEKRVRRGSFESVPESPRLRNTWRRPTRIPSRLYGMSAQILTKLSRLFDTRLAQSAQVPVVNARTPFNHPCEILGDLSYVRTQRGTLEGLRVVFIGVLATSKSGTAIIFTGPP